MKGWRKEFESQFKDNYPTVSITWNGNAPTLVIPDNLVSVKDEIVFFAELLGRECGVVLQFGGSLTQREPDVKPGPAEEMEMWREDQEAAYQEIMRKASRR